MLARAGKVWVDGPLIAFITESLRETRTAVAPLEPSIAVDAVELPAWDHLDPADRIIVATARKMGAVLVTRDTAILDYAESAKAVRILEPRWRGTSTMARRSSSPSATNCTRPLCLAQPQRWRSPRLLPLNPRGER